MTTTTISMTVRGEDMGRAAPPEEVAMALEAALGRIARLEKALAELLLKNEQLRRQLGSIGV